MFHQNLINAADRTTAKKFDYVFLLDGSTSTGRESFEKAKNFLKTFIKRLPKGMNDYRLVLHFLTHLLWKFAVPNVRGALPNISDKRYS